MPSKTEPARKPVNLSLNQDLLNEAREHDINLSRAAERGIAEELADRKRVLWRSENRKALDTWNDFVEQEGLPLAKYRQF